MYWKHMEIVSSICLCKCKILSEALKFESVLCVDGQVKKKITLSLINTNHSTREQNSEKLEERNFSQEIKNTANNKSFTSI